MNRWSGVIKGFEIAREYARLIHSNSPTFQYIRINNWAWRVRWRSPVEASSGDMVDLCPLSAAEILAIELFAIKYNLELDGLQSRLATRDDIVWQYSDDAQLSLEQGKNFSDEERRNIYEHEFQYIGTADDGWIHCPARRTIVILPTHYRYDKYHTV